MLENQESKGISRFRKCRIGDCGFLLGSYLHAKSVAKRPTWGLSAVKFVENLGLFAYCEFFWNLQFAVANLLNVYILEGHDFDLLDESVGAVDIPNPDILHV